MAAGGPIAARVFGDGLGRMTRIGIRTTEFSASMRLEERAAVSREFRDATAGRLGEVRGSGRTPSPLNSLI